MNKFGISYYSMQAGQRVPLSGVAVRILRPAQAWEHGLPLTETSAGSGYYEIVLLSEADCGYYEVWDNTSGLPAFSGKTYTIGKMDYRGLGLAAVTQSRIQNAAVSFDKLGQECVREVHILDGAVTSSKIGTAAVTNWKIADNAVNNEKIDNLAVDTRHINDRAVTPDKLSFAVMSGVPRLLIQYSDKGMGNISGSTPPDYSRDTTYTHTIEYESKLEPVVMVEQRTRPSVEIESILCSLLPSGQSRLTVVVYGPSERPADYRIIVFLI